jgi:hypothetical protein
MSVLTLTACVYPTPDADFVVHVPDAQRATALRTSVEQFAQRCGLKKYEGADESRSPNEPAEITAQRTKTTYFLSGEVSGGISLTYYDAEPGCKVIKLGELERDWTPVGRKAIAEFRETLTKIDGLRVDMGNSPDSWRKTGRSPFDYCAADISGAAPPTDRAAP